MQKPFPAALLLVAFARAACGGKTVEIASRDDDSVPSGAAAAQPPPDPWSDVLPPPPPLTPPPATPCGTSFRTTVMPTLQEHGCATSQCHGGASPRNLPQIDPADPEGTWSRFHGFTLSNGQRYLAPTATIPAASAMHCHLRGECGTSMLGLASAFSPKELAEIDDWLACGAPLD